MLELCGEVLLLVRPFHSNTFAFLCSARARGLFFRDFLPICSKPLRRGPSGGIAIFRTPSQWVFSAPQRGSCECHRRPRAIRSLLMSTSKRSRAEGFPSLDLDDDGASNMKRDVFLRSAMSCARLARVSAESDVSCDGDCEHAGRATLCSACGEREQARFSQVLLRNASPPQLDHASQSTSSEVGSAGDGLVQIRKGFDEEAETSSCDCQTAGRAALCPVCSALEQARFISIVQTSSLRALPVSQPRALGIADFLLS